MDAQLAQLVEQRIENPRVRGSNPRLGTTFSLKNCIFLHFKSDRAGNTPERCQHARNCSFPSMQPVPDAPGVGAVAPAKTTQHIFEDQCRRNLALFGNAGAAQSDYGFRVS